MNRRQFLAAGGSAAVASMVARSPAAEAAGPALIVDTHQHLWDRNILTLPWLADAPEVLRPSYHLKEYADATQGLTVKAVYMEVDVAPRQLADEADHVVGLCREGTHPTIAAVIGSRPDSPGFAEYLDRFKAVPEVKGVRRVLHGPETPAGHCLTEEFGRGVRLLGDRGLSFDLCMRPTELGDAARLTELCPDTRFILDHCGNADVLAFRASKPSADQPPAEHKVDDWKRSIDRLADRPNVICKISGIIARLPAGGDAGDLAPIVNHCLDAFGPDRVVFGGDWPVCLLGASLKTWITMLQEIIASRPAEARKKLWADNAVRHYGLKVD